mmetsp:Transcript_80858/g.261847  ORF Transcript_80858/g.261847 Transcript_80858/m.261847 type:complete len:451 (+) Transcript_80858:80-1432(+)
MCSSAQEDPQGRAQDCQHGPRTERGVRFLLAAAGARLGRRGLLGRGVRLGRARLGRLGRGRHDHLGRRAPQVVNDRGLQAVGGRARGERGLGPGRGRAVRPEGVVHLHPARLQAPAARLRQPPAREGEVHVNPALGDLGQARDGRFHSCLGFGARHKLRRVRDGQGQVALHLLRHRESRRRGTRHAPGAAAGGRGRFVLAAVPREVLQDRRHGRHLGMQLLRAGRVVELADRLTMVRANVAHYQAAPGIERRGHLVRSVGAGVQAGVHRLVAGVQGAALLARQPRAAAHRGQVQREAGPEVRPHLPREHGRVAVWKRGEEQERELPARDRAPRKTLAPARGLGQVRPLAAVRRAGGLVRQEVVLQAARVLVEGQAAGPAGTTGAAILAERGHDGAHGDVGPVNCIEQRAADLRGRLLARVGRQGSSEDLFTDPGLRNHVVAGPGVADLAH